MTRRSPHGALVAAAGLTAWLVAGGVANAQTSAATASGAAPSGGGAQLEEVIVTATKREANLQDVPVAVTAVSGSSLVADHVFNARDLADNQPGLAYTDFTSFEQQIAIRGIVTVGLGDPTAEPAVGTFIDGVYIGGQGVTMNQYYDLDHIEIIRGPQGVLLGKNVTGGALSIVTAKPEFTSSGSVDASYGNFETFNVTGHYTGPISDTLAGRVAFQVRDSDGYARSLLLDRHMDGYSSEQVRAELLWKPSDKLQALLSVDFGKQWTSGDERSATPDPFGANPFSPTGTGGQVTYQQEHPTSSVYEGFDGDPDYSLQQSTSVTLTVDWNVLPQAKLTSISNARWGAGTNFFQQLQAPSPPLALTSTVLTNEKPREFSEDLRLASTEEALPFNYIAGVYWYKENAPFFSENNAISPALFCGAFGGIICGESAYYEQPHILTDAVYGQLGYEITKGLTFTVGARYTEDKKNGTKSADCLQNYLGIVDPALGYQTCSTPLSIPLGTTYDVPFGHNWNAFTPQALLNYQFLPDHMVYASVNKGFKGGGWDQFPPTGQIASIGFNPETALNYEVGTKNEFLDHTLRVNLSVYYLSYKNLQVQEINDICLCLVTNNAGSAVSKGFELETQYIVNQTLKLGLSGAYIDAYYIRFTDPGPPVTNEAGHQLPDVPREKGTFSFALTPDLGGNVGRSFELRGEWTVQSKYFIAPGNTDYEGGYGLVNAFLTYQRPDSPWSIGLWGRNLTDKVFPLYQDAFLGDVQTAWGPPREYGVQGHYSFK